MNRKLKTGNYNPSFPIKNLIMANVNREIKASHAVKFKEKLNEYNGSLNWSMLDYLKAYINFNADYSWVYNKYLIFKKNITIGNIINLYFNNNRSGFKFKKGQSKIVNIDYSDWFLNKLATLDDIKWVPKKTEPKPESKTWTFKSSSSDKTYKVKQTDNTLKCNCMGFFRAKDRRCKHNKSVEKEINKNDKKT